MQMFYLHKYLGRLLFFCVVLTECFSGKKKEEKKQSVLEYVVVPLPHKAFCIEVKAIPLG